jgi:ketosteroid isomerase-like protein
MEKHPVINQIEKADKAIVAEDFDTLLDIYTDDAILVVEPRRNAVGKDAIRKAFTRYQAQLGEVRWFVIKLGQKFSKRNCGYRHYQAELGSELRIKHWPIKMQEIRRDATRSYSRPTKLVAELNVRLT